MVTENPENPSSKTTPPSKSSQMRTLVFGGILPVVIFTVIEDHYGPIYGTIAAIIYGISEVLYELIKYKKVEAITWVSNGLIICLGAVSIFFNDGIWFKLQPAIMELFFALFLWGTLITKKNLFLMMAEKQGQKVPEVLIPRMNGITLRLGIFFLLHAILATWAAFHWSTTNWALLKGVGVTVSMLVYVLIEAVYLRSQIRKP